MTNIMRIRKLAAEFRRARPYLLIGFTLAISFGSAPRSGAASNSGAPPVETASGAITGRIADALDNPVSGALVSCDGISARTGSDGVYRLANVPAGTRQLTVSAAGASSGPFPVTVSPDADAVIPVRVGASMGSIEGSVGGSGGPVGGATVEAVSDGIVRASLATAPDGRFILPLIAGVYDLRASAPGFSSESVPVSVVGQSSVQLSLDRLGGIMGAVSAASGAPAANVRVLIASRTAVFDVVTSAAGKFARSGIAPGVYTVLANPSASIQARSEVVVPPGSTAVVSLYLDQTEPAQSIRAGGALAIAPVPAAAAGMNAANIQPRAQGAQPSWPAQTAAIDAFGGDTRVTSAVPAKGQVFEGTITAITATTLTDSGANFPTDGSMVGQYLNPDINRGDSGDNTYNERWFRINSNTATTITVEPDDGSMLAIGRAPKVGSKYQVMSPFTVEKIGNQWWFIDPAGHGFFAKAVSKVDDTNLKEAANRYDAVFLQNAAGTFSSNLNYAAEDTHAIDVVDGRGITVSDVGDTVYIGSLKPFNVTAFYMSTLGSGGQIQWYYSAGDSWNLVNRDGNPATAVAANADRSFNFDIGNFPANGLGSILANGNKLNWWKVQTSSGKTSLFPSDFAPTSLSADGVPRFYIKGVVTTAFTSPPQLGRIIDAPSIRSMTDIKYGGSYSNWFNAVNTRLDNWGLNSVGQYSYRYTTNDGAFPSTRKPVEPVVQISGSTMLASSKYRVKSVYDGATCSPGGQVMYQGLSPDVFDPGYPGTVRDLARGAAIRYNGPWSMFIVADEADFEFGFNQPSTHAHAGYVILSQNPYHPSSYSGGKIPGISYSDPKLYSKYALRDFLRYAYRDPSDTDLAPFAIDSAVPAYAYSAVPDGLELAALQNLNTAWGTSYTTWDTASGDIGSGTNAYGSGSGFMDENGSGVVTSAANCTTITGDLFQKAGYAAVRKDLDNFVALYAAKLASTVYSAVKKYSNNLVALPVYRPTPAIASAIAPYVDLLWYSPPQDPAYARSVYDALGKPLVATDYYTSEGDSPLWFGGTVTNVRYDASSNRTLIDYSGRPFNLLFGQPIGFPDSSCAAGTAPMVVAADWTHLEVNGDYTRCVAPGQRVQLSTKGQTQQNGRYNAIKSLIDLSVRTYGKDGVGFTIGWEHWAYYDDAPFSYEFGQFGLVTAADNAYDGYEATTQVGKDDAGRWVGGENYDYGNILGPLAGYLHSVYDVLAGRRPVSGPRRGR